MDLNELPLLIITDKTIGLRPQNIVILTATADDDVSEIRPHSAADRGVRVCVSRYDPSSDMPGYLICVRFDHNLIYSTFFLFLSSY